VCWFGVSSLYEIYLLVWFRYACASGSISINALVSAISAGMRALPNDHVIQTNGSRLLAHIAVKDSNQLPIAKECGVKAIIEAMKNFLSDSSIQECCCRVLGLLSYNCMSVDRF
jgi:hypothetical protein